MRIGAYEVLLELGRGGMGAVYLARLSGAGDFERLVAIKRALPQSLADDDTRERFLHEARLAAYVHHANVVGIHQVGTDAVGPYLACDYVEGESLAGLIERTRKEARIPPPVALRIAIDALAGLSAIHDAVDGSGRSLGVLHRDVSIENLLIGRDGVTRITDFGIAKSVVSPVRTEAGAIHGKLLYLTPEYLQGQTPDRTCDTYAMGITLFAGLTSTYPFRTEDVNFLVEQIVSAPMPSLRSRNVDASPELEAVVAKATSRHPADRYQDATSMLEALERAALTSGGLARQQDVAAFVERVAGKELRARREAIQARRGDIAAPAVPAPVEPWESVVQAALPETVVDTHLQSSQSGRPQSSRPPTRSADARFTVIALGVLLLGMSAFFYLERSPSGAAKDAPRELTVALRDAAVPARSSAEVGTPIAPAPTPTLQVLDAGSSSVSLPDAAAKPTEALAPHARTEPLPAARPPRATGSSITPPSTRSPVSEKPTPLIETPSVGPKPAVGEKPAAPKPGISLDNPYR